MAVGRLSRLRDGFLPRSLAAEDVANQTARRRVQRFILLLLVIAVGSAASALAQAVQGLVASSLAATVGVGLAFGGLVMVRRGFGTQWLVFVFMTLAALLTAAMALAAGHDGVISLFWLGLAAPITLSLAGPRLATWVLALDALLITACLTIMYTVNYPPLIDVHDAVGAHVVSMLGAVFTFYALIRAYESETERNISELEVRNTDLAAARAVADQASRAKSEFLATMSHEIRTPMNGVLGMTSVMLAEGHLPSDVREGLQTIHQSGTTLLAVINDILDFSKLESGKLVLEQVPVAVRSDLAAIAALLDQLARERHDELVIAVADDVPAWVVGDAVRLRQVVLNLVSNALKFTTNGHVQVDVTAVGGQLKLAVTDSGIGMTAEVLSRLFTPFAQADASTTRRFGGTGLGLAIVRRLVDAMKGSVTATSAPGEGSCFTVTLPLVAAEAPLPEPAREAAPCRRLRVLVAEDNPVNQRVALRLLEQLGHDVVVAGNGVEALQQLDGEPFDVVLMDCHMPVMDGFETTRTLRTSPRPRVPVFALTASSLPEERARCLECGMDEVLTKPVRRDDLEAALRKVA